MYLSSEYAVRTCKYKLNNVVVVLGFYVPPTDKVIRRRGLGLNTHPKDWRSWGSNSRPLVYKASSFTMLLKLNKNIKKRCAGMHFRIRSGY